MKYRSISVGMGPPGGARRHSGPPLIVRTAPTAAGDKAATAGRGASPTSRLLVLTLTAPCHSDGIKHRVPHTLDILSNFPRVDWDLTLSMSVFTARQIHHSSPRVNIGKWKLDRMTICGSLGASQVNLCPQDRLNALGIFLRKTLGLRPRVCLRKIPRAFNLALGQNSPGYPLGKLK